MYAPGFVTGSLINRFGVLNVILAGVLVMALGAIIALAGITYGHFVAALVLIGVGWNFMYTGGTTLLTESYPPAEKARTQGANDFIMFSTMALSSFSSGALVSAAGWDVMNWGALPFLALVAVVVLWYARCAVGRCPPRCESGPIPSTTHFWLVRPSRPTGPRACSLLVEMPISAPRPNSNPSAKRVDALTSTELESTSRRKRIAVRVVLRHDRVGVLRAVSRDVRDRLVERVDDADGEDRRQVLGVPIVLGRGLHRGNQRARALAAAQLDALLRVDRRTAEAGRAPRCPMCTSSVSIVLHGE